MDLSRLSMPENVRNLLGDEDVPQADGQACRLLLEPYEVKWLAG